MGSCFTGRRDRSCQTPEKDILYIVCLVHGVCRNVFKRKMNLKFSTNLYILLNFKGCRGIVFTHGVWMGGQAGGRREKVSLGCISETVRCRKLILGMDTGWRLEVCNIMVCIII